MCVAEQEDFLCVVSCRCVTTLNLALVYGIYVCTVYRHMYVCVCVSTGEAAECDVRVQRAEQ